MSKKKKYGTVKIETKPAWEVARGHHEFRSATCTVMGDKRTKRGRTRNAAKRNAMRDYE